MHSVTFQAKLYDGTSARPREVTVAGEVNGQLRVLEEGRALLQLQKADYEWTLPTGQGPIRVRAKDGILLQTEFNDALNSYFLAHSNSVFARIWRLESSLKSSLALLVAAVITALGVYFYGIPITASVLKPLMPHSMKESIGERTIEAFERLAKEKTTISTTRQAELRAQASALAAHAKFPHDVKLHFFNLKMANAFATPPYHMALTDKIISLLDEDQLEAVLAHELGHLVHDHVTTRIIEGSLVSVASLLLFGSDPNLIQSLALGVVDAQYSQEHEREADLFAAKLLASQGKRPAALADALEALQKKSGAQIELLKYFGTHPLTTERIQTLRNFERFPN